MKTKLTQETQQKIVSAIEDGNYAKVAAEAAGIDESTFYRWMRDGEKAKSGKMRQFYQSVNRARASSESTAVSEWTAQGKRDWRAWMEFLARRFPERWANTQRVEILIQQRLEDEFTAALGALEDALDPEEFRKATTALAAISGETET